jgi:RimJ/RimL family protein N-acetyltransferase
MKTTPLETSRLRLRALANADWEAYSRMCADAETMQFIGEGKTLTRAETWRSIAFFLGHWELRGYGMWAVEEKATGAFLGRVGLHKPEDWPGLEIGWMIDRNRWREGFASEAGRAAMDFAFGQLNIDRLISLIHPRNAGSVRVAEKLGMNRGAALMLQGREVLVYERASDQRKASFPRIS